MSRSIFGWSYPPGCSGPPEGDTICEVCGGDVESSTVGCICEHLLPAQTDDEIGDVRKLLPRDLARLQERFSLAAFNLEREQRRRYAEQPSICSICKKPMTFDEIRSQEINCHGACMAKEQEAEERLPRSEPDWEQSSTEQIEPHF